MTDPTLDDLARSIKALGGDDPSTLMESLLTYPHPIALYPEVKAETAGLLPLYRLLVKSDSGHDDLIEAYDRLFES